MFKTKVWILMAVVLAITSVMVAKQKSAPEKITQGPVVEGVGDNWAVIAWTTDTGGSSVVHYGIDPKNLNQTGESPYADNEKTTSQNHRVHLKNLKPGTTYYFIADSGQGEGTGTEAKSSIGQFTTRGSAQGGGQGTEKAMALKIIDGPRVEGVGKD